MQTEERVQKIPLKKALISELNTRQPKPTDPHVIELAKSIKERGQTTPAIARPHPKKKGCYEIGAGSCRRVACEVAGKPTLDTIVREMSDDDFMELILVENLQRTDPDPRAEADLLQRLVARGLRTPAQIAAHLGKDEKWAARRLKLTLLHPDLLKLWKGGDLFHFSTEMMELLASLPENLQKELAEDPWEIRRAASRKELEQHLASEFCILSAAPFDLNDPRFFHEDCGPGCKTDSSREPLLFDFYDGKKKKKKDSCGRCMNSACYFARLAKWRAVRVEELTGGETLPVYSHQYGERITVGDTVVNTNFIYGDTNLSEKETPGSRKVLLVAKNGDLLVRYIPREKETPEGRGEVKSEATKKKEKIAMLQSKRWALVREEIVKAVEKATLDELTVDVVDLVTAIGLPYRLRSESYNPQNAAWKILEEGANGQFPLFKLVDRDRKKLVPRNEALWSAAKQVLLDLIPEPDKVSSTLKFVPNFHGIAKLINFPIEQAKRKADLEIRPPKSWGAVDPHTLEPIAGTPAPTKKPAAKPAAGNWIVVGDGSTRKKKPVGRLARKLANAA